MVKELFYKKYLVKDTMYFNFFKIYKNKEDQPKNQNLEAGLFYSTIKEFNLVVFRKSQQFNKSILLDISKV